jgi:hypothetical protein
MPVSECHHTTRSEFQGASGRAKGRSGVIHHVQLTEGRARCGVAITCSFIFIVALMMREKSLSVCYSSRVLEYSRELRA